MGTIRIESILGGHSITTHFAGKDQFRDSLGINPALPYSDSATDVFGVKASGLLRPGGNKTVTGDTIGTTPLWMRGARATTSVFIYDANGSAYAMSFTPTITALSDGGTLSTSSGNGLAYNDNYIYFAKNTDIARYGPLSSATTQADAAFDGSYWVTTLGKTALTNTTYPSVTDFALPNHVLHRHSDGKLYIADTVSGQGSISYIATKKVTFEGDTNDGSTYNKLAFGFGLFPTALESYGERLAIALYEHDSTNSQSYSSRANRAKLAFWDTTSTNFNSITWDEFPDPIITAMKNIDGILYVVSALTSSGRGYRISQYVGGYTFKEVWYSETGSPCMPGAIDGTSARLLFGATTLVPESAGCVYSLGLQKAALSRGLFNTFRLAGTATTRSVTSVLLGNSIAANFGFDYPFAGWRDTGSASAGIESQQTNNYSASAPSVWWSQVYKIGQPFIIKRVRIPLAQAVAAGMTVVPKIYFDDGQASLTLPTINTTTYPNSERVANIRTDTTGTSVGMGQNNFWLELKWSGTTLCTIGLPIVIDFEIIPD